VAGSERGGRQMGQRTRQLVVALHILFAGLWIGFIASVLVISYLLPPSESAGALVTRHTILDLIDSFVIIPACFASLFTGIAFMRFTLWGFVLYRWVIVKWVATVTMIGFGAFCLGPVDNDHGPAGHAARAGGGDRAVFSDGQPDDAPLHPAAS
jgi:hypothetical protein